MLEALRDVLPGIPPGWGLYESTDSASWVESFEHGSKLKLRRRVRKRVRKRAHGACAVRARLRGEKLPIWASPRSENRVFFLPSACR